jgi:hypothetical protein
MCLSAFSISADSYINVLSAFSISSLFSIFTFRWPLILMCLSAFSISSILYASCLSMASNYPIAFRLLLYNVSSLCILSYLSAASYTNVPSTFSISSLPFASCLSTASVYPIAARLLLSAIILFSILCGQSALTTFPLCGQSALTTFPLCGQSALTTLPLCGQSALTTSLMRPIRFNNFPKKKWPTHFLRLCGAPTKHVAHPPPFVWYSITIHPAPYRSPLHLTASHCISP